MKKFQVVFNCKHVIAPLIQIINCPVMPTNNEVKQILKDLITKHDVRAEGDYLKVTQIVSVIELM
jgi:hypothetical protein